MATNKNSNKMYSKIIKISAAFSFITYLSSLSSIFVKVFGSISMLNVLTIYSKIKNVGFYWDIGI